MCQKSNVFIFNRLQNKKSVHFRTLCPEMNVRLFAVVRKAHSEPGAITYFRSDGEKTIQRLVNGLANT